MSSNDKDCQKERREFLKKGIAAAGSGLLLASAIKVGGATAQNSIDGGADSVLPLPKDLPADKNLLRMYQELHRALEKPMDQRQWVMVIDREKCVGCVSCTVACKAENCLPPGVVYRPVIDEEVGKFPNVRRRYLPRPCMHCEKPPCTKVCPVKATYKRSDGIVSINYEKCIGCRYCINACPYGARGFDWGEYYTEDTPEIQSYELQPGFEYGTARVRGKGKSPVGNARKCHFCIHRVNKGALPACVTTCMGRSTYFGDYSDRHSLVAELIGSTNVTRLKEELGTGPSVYYLS